MLGGVGLGVLGRPKMLGRRPKMLKNVRGVGCWEFRTFDFGIYVFGHFRFAFSNLDLGIFDLGIFDLGFWQLGCRPKKLDLTLKPKKHTPT